MPVSRQDVELCYRQLLGRAPESEAVIDEKIRRYATKLQLMGGIVASHEFRSKVNSKGRRLLGRIGDSSQGNGDTGELEAFRRDVERRKRREDFALIKRIVRENLGRHWKGYAITIAMTCVVAACTSIAAYLIGSIVNAAFLKQSFASIVGLSGVWSILFAVRGLASYGQEVFVARIGNRITAETQRRIFEKLLQQGVDYFADRHSTQFMANAVVGASAIANILNQLVLAIGRDVLTMAGLIGLMIWQDPLMSLISLSVMPPALIGVERLVSRAREIAATQFSGSAAMLGTMQEVVQGFRIVKAYNIEDAMRRRVDSNVATLEQASNRLAKVANWSSPLVETFGGLAIGLAYLYCGYRVLQTNAAPGDFVSFTMAFILTFEPARRIARLKIELSGNIVAAHSLYALFDSKSAESDAFDKPRLSAKSGRIEFANVDFSYRRGEPVLRKMSFVAEPGRVTALVGLSGGGKTTIYNLLLRFYDVDGGSILIDGQNIQGFARDSIRAQIGYVGQEIYLFHGTVRENILVGKPDATEAEMVAAARAAYAHDFITSLYMGYDTPVGESGSLLSLGQRQRIALARAFIKDAPIVLLDEPTASLDSESEGYVQQAIRKLCEGKTTLAIAHRLNTIRDADCIHVVENGSVVESGSHHALLLRNGRYSKFFRLQFPQELDLVAR